jgi:tetratricopeptide (TPR) repeat protein
MRFPSLRAAVGNALSRAWRARYVLLPMAALAVVVAMNLWSQAAVPVAPVAPVAQVAPVDLSGPAAPAEGVDPLTDITPTEQGLPFAGVDTSDTDSRIAFWQARLAATPTSDTSWTYLGDLYDIKGRQTGDLSNYSAARDAYTKAVEFSPASPTARLGLARVSVTLHDFRAALEAATGVLEEYPAADGALAIIFDAAYELGDLDIARTALAQLDIRSASPAVTVRTARLAFVAGDAATAVRLSSEAADTAEARADSAASVAFYRYAAGEYALLAGDPETADANFRSSLESLPGYALAIAGRGRAAIARNDFEAAIGFLEMATAAVPRPDHVALLGDLYSLSGRTAEADEQYATVEFIHGLAVADGARVYDREFALYLADHGKEAAQALELAQAESEVRHDIYGFDTVAWTLHANGREAEALTQIHEALATGTIDSKLLIHAGLIELANGLTADGVAHLEQAMALNPGSSPLVVHAARAALEEAR